MNSSRAARVVTFVLLSIVALATVLGLALLWPDYAKVGEVADRASYQAEGVVFEQGEILSVGDCTAQREAPQDSGPDEPGAGGQSGGASVDGVQQGGKWINKM